MGYDGLGDLRRATMACDGMRRLTMGSKISKVGGQNLGVILRVKFRAQNWGQKWGQKITSPRARVVARVVAREI